MSKYLFCEAGGSGSEELMEYPPSFLVVLWFVNVLETKTRQKKKVYIRHLLIYFVESIFQAFLLQKRELFQGNSLWK